MIFGCFSLIWVFGNIDYFGYYKRLNPRRVQGEIISNNELKVISKPLAYSPEDSSLNNRYMDEIFDRASSTMTTQVLAFTVVGYLIFLVVFHIYRSIQNLVHSEPAKNHLRKISEDPNYKNFSHFEELVAKNDIIYESTLASVMKGREVGGPRIMRMHNRRLTNLGTMLVRKISGKQSYKEIKKKKTQRFTTLSSYDFRVTCFHFS